MGMCLIRMLMYHTCYHVLPMQGSFHLMLHVTTDQMRTMQYLCVKSLLVFGCFALLCSCATLC
jgi:hypothetical protein